MDIEEARLAVSICRAVAERSWEKRLRDLGAHSAAELRFTRENRRYPDPAVRKALQWLGERLEFTRGCVVRAHGRSVIAFQGTAPIGDAFSRRPVKSVEEFVRQVEAFSGWSHNYLYAYRPDILEALAEYGFAFPGLVHPGITAILVRHEWGQIEGAALAAEHDGGLILTGHSQGGVLATLSAYRLAQRGIPVRAVYTFGSPRPGDDTFRDRYDQEVEHYRFESVADIVPLLLPPPFALRDIAVWLYDLLLERNRYQPAIDYRHVGRLVLTGGGGEFVPEFPGLGARRVQALLEMLEDREGRKALQYGHGIDEYERIVARLVV
ncbi:hypothetical protein [Streptomyces sp. NPDC003077]|uniref:lipase family protein n=1 Tax=Streptomyces sp. NPDC003077 TaxID=3154443 RepID=UPI0033A3EE37